jgi:hypothetical protein
MSQQEDVELGRRMFAAFNRGDVEAVLEAQAAPERREPAC